MSKIASHAALVWKSAQLYIGFHRDPKGRQRSAPKVWPPKDARARIHADPDIQETFLMLKSADGDADQDVQIKLRPDMVVLRRDYDGGWEGIIADAHSVAVKVGGVSITREDGDSTTWVEADGGVLKKTEFVESAVYSDGMEMTRRTPDNLTAITPRGLLSKDR